MSAFLQTKKTKLISNYFSSSLWTFINNYFKFTEDSKIKNPLIIYYIKDNTKVPLKIFVAFTCDSPSIKFRIKCDKGKC